MRTSQDIADITTKLREGTRDQHRSIEKHVPVLRPDLDTGKYLQILERFYGFYKPFEMMLEASLGRLQSLQFEGRKKLSLLLKDLVFLGDDVRKIETLPLCRDLPPIETSASALGALYVLEGSTLGGQIISGHLQKKIGVTPETGAAFYVSYGDDTRTRWVEFQDVLREELKTEAQQSEAVIAAQRTFSALEKWMAT